MKANLPTKQIILIGFKSVGKSVIGQEIAKRLQKPFIDLDHTVEHIFESINKNKLTCRQIMLEKGQDYFRNLENKALREIIGSEPSIISLGGGTPLNEENQLLLQGNYIVHVIAPRSVTFERIMTHGRPAFFMPNENPLETFNRLWDEREKVYKKLATVTVENTGSIEQVAHQILLMHGQLLYE